jgi:hypothetical protein
MDERVNLVLHLMSTNMCLLNTAIVPFSSCMCRSVLSPMSSFIVDLKLFAIITSIDFDPLIDESDAIFNLKMLINYPSEAASTTGCERNSENANVECLKSDISSRKHS